MYSETPIYDALNEQTRCFTDTMVHPIHQRVAVEQSLAANALADMKSEKTIPLEGWSPGATDAIKDLNQAIQRGSRMVGSESYINFINNQIRNGHIPSHEVTAFRKLGDTV